jgi:hypothetical protein
MIPRMTNTMINAIAAAKNGTGVNVGCLSSLLLTRCSGSPA